MQEFKKRRNRVAKSLPDKSLLILSSWPESYRQIDVMHPYRQDSNLYYLTGYTKPDCLFVLKPSGESYLFIRDRDSVREVWDGIRQSTSEVKKIFLLDKVYYKEEAESILNKLTKNTNQIFYNNVNNTSWNSYIKKIKAKKSPAEARLASFRKNKDKDEIACLKKATRITAYAHQALARALKPQVSERYLHGVFLQALREKSAEREGYPSIIASGNQACTLHYTANDQICRRGELVLVDAAAECDYYTADVTRVYPCSGKFSKTQKKVYDLLLKLQKNLIRECRPGVTLKSVN